MESLVLKVYSDAKDVELTIPQPTEANKDNVIQGFFGLFGVAVDSSKITATVQVSSPKPVQKTPVTAPTKQVTTPVPAKAEDKTVGVPKVTPLISSPPPVFTTKKEEEEPTSMAAALAKHGIDGKKDTSKYDGDTPLHFKTGYKVHPETQAKSYKCHYKCPECEAKGNHYIWEGSKKVRCHTCHEEMDVHLAVPNEHNALVKPDAMKNWYVGGTQKPYDEPYKPMS